MDSEFIQEAKTALLQEREKTKEQIQKCEEEERNVRNGSERENIFNPAAVNQHNHRSLEEKLDDINAALIRIDNETYGICICGCGHEIDKERLRRGDYYVKRRTPDQKEWDKNNPRKYW